MLAIGNPFTSLTTRKKTACAHCFDLNRIISEVDPVFVGFMHLAVVVACLIFMDQTKGLQEAAIALSRVPPPLEGQGAAAEPFLQQVVRDCPGGPAFLQPRRVGHSDRGRFVCEFVLQSIS